MGFFSWKTSDTKRSISNKYSNRGTFEVFMITKDRRIWKEEQYDGYGVFGGKKFYELVKELNPGVLLELPKLVEKVNPQNEKWEIYFNSLPESENCENQGFFYDEDKEWGRKSSSNGDKIYDNNK